MEVIRSASTDADFARARALFEEYAAELGVDLCFQGFPTELAELPGKYAPPRGVLFIVLDDGAPIACGALRNLGELACELKRIYVRPSHRGTGLGRRITVDLMQRAKDIGYSIVRLDTLGKLTAAQSLYRSLGFREVDPFNLDPGLGIVYFERPI